MKHIGLNEHRLRVQECQLERRFSSEWEKQAPHWLAHILKDDQYSQRDATIAATVIQWLGSNVGRSFASEIYAEQEREHRLEKADRQLKSLHV